MELKIGEDAYPFDLDELRNDEADALERLAGCSITEFTKRLRGGYSSAMTQFVWLMKRRDDPSIKVSDIRFRLSDVSVQYADDEAVEILRSFKDDEDGTAEEQQAEFLASLPEEQRVRLADPAVAGAPLDLGELE